MAENLFRQAKQLLDKKDAGSQLTKKELRLISRAIIPLMVKTDGLFPRDITIAEGLEELAKILDQAKVAESRGRVVVTQRPHKPVTQVRILPPLPVI